MISLTDYIIESNKFNVYIMCGLPGSGKSTWVKETHPEAKIISRDIIRVELGFTKNVDEKTILSREQEKQVTEREYELIRKYAMKRKPFVIDDLNTGRYRKDLIRTLKRYDAHVVGVNVMTPVETCIERRKGQITADNIRKVANRMQFIRKDEVDEVVNVEK